PRARGAARARERARARQGRGRARRRGARDARGGTTVQRPARPRATRRPHDHPARGARHRRGDGRPRRDAARGPAGRRRPPAGALAQEGPGTLPGVSVGVEAPALPGMTEVETAVADVWATGVSTDSYPTQHVRDGLTAAGVLTVVGAVEVSREIERVDEAERA